MKEPYLKVTYRHGKPLAAYYYLPERHGQKSVRCEEPEEGLVVDFGQDGKPNGIEIIHPAHLTLEAMNRVLTQLGFPKVTQKDLAPLEAA